MKIIGLLPLLVIIAPVLLRAQSIYRPDIPKTWDEAALADWATPVAGLNVRPTHISAKEYYWAHAEMSAFFAHSIRK